MNTVLNFFYLLAISVLGFYWKLLCLNINFAASFFFQGRLPPTPHPRKLPLHTCALSVLTTIDRFYVKSQQFDGPIPSMLRTLCEFVALQTEPYTCGIKHRFLSILTKADDEILGYESVMEEDLPLLRHVFDKIDNLVRCAETVPVKVDGFVDKLSVFIRMVPFLKLLFACTLFWLEFWVAMILSFREWKNMEEGQPLEKDIQIDDIDANYRKSSMIGESDFVDDLYSLENIEVEKGMYMDLFLENSKEQEDEGEERDKHEEVEETIVEDANNDGGSDSDRDNDPILDLFDSGWLMSPNRKDRQMNTMMIRAYSFS